LIVEFTEFDWSMGEILSGGGHDDARKMIMMIERVRGNDFEETLQHRAHNLLAAEARLNSKVQRAGDHP